VCPHAVFSAQKRDNILAKRKVSRKDLLGEGGDGGGLSAPCSASQVVGSRQSTSAFDELAPPVIEIPCLGSTGRGTAPAMRG